MDEFSLTDHFLIAMPNMTDPNFAGTVVYLCEHNEHGAMGVVVNRPAEVSLGELFDQIDLSLPPGELPDSRCARAGRCKPTVALCCISR